MQTRDLYQYDYTTTYYPKIDINTFQEDMYTFKRGRLDTILYDADDLKEDADIYDVERKSQLAAFCVGLGTIIGYNKIPIINRVQGKWKKFAFKVFLFFLPLTISGGFQVSRSQTSISRVYQKHFENYCKFKQSGDLRCLNSNIEFGE